jgi:hypothetical protein
VPGSLALAKFGSAELDGVSGVSQGLCLIPRGRVNARVKDPLMDFHSPYSHGFVRCATCTPECEVADPEFNANAILDLARKGHDQKSR